MNLSYEFQYTLRSLQKKLGFSLSCMFVVALGISITIPLYYLVRNFAYAPLHFPDGDRIVTFKTGGNLSVNPETFDVFQFNAIKESANSFDVLAMERQPVAVFSDGDYAQSYFGKSISAQGFDLAQTSAVLGRGLLPSDELAEAEPVAVISDYVWQSYYDSRTDVVGTLSRINGSAYTIVGVMPPGFRFPQMAEVWFPLSANNLALPEDDAPVQIIAKLKPGVSREAATLEVGAILQKLAQEYPENYTQAAVEIAPLTQRGTAGAGGIAGTFGGLAFCIFVLVCLNASNLLAIRANERINELAIRTAVGATKRSLSANILFESFFICVGGAIAGLILASFILQYCESLFFSPQQGGRGLPFWFDFGLSVDVVVVAIFLILIVWFTSSFLVSWRVGNLDISVTLANESKGSVSEQSGRVMRGLVGFQIVLSFFLLVLSGVFVLEARSILEVDKLAESESFFTAGIVLPDNLYSNLEDKSLYRQQFRQRLLEEPSIQTVAFNSTVPSMGGFGYTVLLQGEEITEGLQPPQSGIKWIDEFYFEAIGARDLLEGRFFEASDNASAEQLVVVDNLFVQEKNIAGSAIGRRIQLYASDNSVAQTATIVGVVNNVVREGIVLGNATAPTIYRLLSQSSPPILQVLIKTRPEWNDSPAALEQRVKIVASQIDRDIPLEQFRSLNELLESNNSILMFMIEMIMYAAVAALALAVISINGQVSRSVRARFFEIGIRRAIGSSNSAIEKLFLKQGISYLILAIVIGGGGSVLVMDSVQSAYPSYGIFSSLLIAFAVVTAIVGSLIGLASYLPVRQVVALEPGDALHYE